jgi:hypothetical protein
MGFLVLTQQAKAPWNTSSSTKKPVSISRALPTLFQWGQVLMVVVGALLPFVAETPWLFIGSSEPCSIPNLPTCSHPRSCLSSSSTLGFQRWQPWDAASAWVRGLSLLPNHFLTHLPSNSNSDEHYWGLYCSLLIIWSSDPHHSVGNCLCFITPLYRLGKQCPSQVCSLYLQSSILRRQR